VFNPDGLVENKITLSQLADDIFYTPLDNSYPVKIVNRIILTQKAIFISSNEGVLKYNRDGKEVRKIGQKGRGPGEYIYSAAFTVDNINETVYIRDRSNVIKVYSESGNYLRDINLREFKGEIDGVEFHNSKLFLSFFLQFGDSQYNWVIIDTLGSIIKQKERTVPCFVSNWSEGSNTYKFNNKLSYWNPYNDTVYSVLPDMNYKASLIFSPGDYRLPKSSFDSEQNITNYMLVRSLFETRRFYVFRYAYNRKGIITLIDKESNKSYVTYVESFESDGLINDIDGYSGFQPVGYYSENQNEYMIGIIEPYVLKKHVTTDDFKNSLPKYPEKKKELEKLANSLKETDNPVLVLVKLKN